MPTQIQSHVLIFDGYCPESKLIGRKVKMRLNSDDFWESEATGLQISVFPPYAAILPWRGEGHFKIHDRVASDEYYSYWLTSTSKQAGQEIFPDTEDLIKDEVDLLLYTLSIYENKAVYSKHQPATADPVKQLQNSILREIGNQTTVTRIDLWEQVNPTMPALKIDTTLLESMVIKA